MAKKKDDIGTPSKPPSQAERGARLHHIFERMAQYPTHHELIHFLKKFDVILQFDDQMEPGIGATYNPLANSIQLSWHVNDETLISEFIPHEIRHAWQFHAETFDADEISVERNIILTRFCEADAYTFATKMKAALFIYLEAMDPEEYQTYVDNVLISDMDAVYFDHLIESNNDIQATQQTFISFFEDRFLCDHYDTQAIDKIDALKDVYTSLNQMLKNNNIDTDNTKDVLDFLNQNYPDLPSMVLKFWQTPNVTAKPLTQNELRKFGFSALDNPKSLNFLDTLEIPLTDSKFTRLPKGLTLPSKSTPHKASKPKL